MSISYRVDLIGTTWSGSQAAYSYEFPESPTSKQIREKAGDFQDITDYRITCTVQTGDWNESVTKRSVTEDWKREDSQEAYLECVA